MEQCHQCTSVSSVEMAWSWLLGVCISNWLCTIPLTHPPLSLPTSILCVCARVHVGKCSASARVCTIKAFWLGVWLRPFLWQLETVLTSTCIHLSPCDHVHSFTKSLLYIVQRNHCKRWSCCEGQTQYVLEILLGLVFYWWLANDLSQ